MVLGCWVKKGLKSTWQAIVSMDERQDSWESTHFTAAVDACPPSSGAASEDAGGTEEADHVPEVGLLNPLQGVELWGHREKGLLPKPNGPACRRQRRRLAGVASAG